MGVKIGVLALQGNVSEHIGAFRGVLKKAGYIGDSRVIPVRDKRDIADLDAIAIPGGESTTIHRLLEKNRMITPLKEFEGGVFATCAGMVLVASELDDSRFTPLARVDITVARNAFGRQRESFEADLEVKGLDAPFHAVFIRAPVVTKWGPDVSVLSRIDASIVAVQQGTTMAFSFHPEIGGDLRLHELFLETLDPDCNLF